MNDPLDRMERLALRARGEVPAPAASVAPEVLRRIRLSAQASDRPLWWVAAGAIAAAALTVVFNYSAVVGATDAAGEFAVYASWMML